ncbi:MAG: hypothetical protein QXV22_04765 [Thermoplasmataceae archaeon]
MTDRKLHLRRTSLIPIPLSVMDEICCSAIEASVYPFPSMRTVTHRSFFLLTSAVMTTTRCFFLALLSPYLRILYSPAFLVLRPESSVAASVSSELGEEISGLAA